MKKVEKKEPIVEKAKRLVLLDAHAILHRAYHAIPDFFSSKGEPTGALFGLSSMLIKIIGDLKPDYLAAAYDLPKPTYRHEAFKDYKAGRAKADHELVAQMKRSREVFEALGIPMYDLAGFEADDMLGTIVQQVQSQKYKVGNREIDIVIASGDMDTLQLVSDKKVQVYTLKKGIKETILYDEAGVCERFKFGPELLPDYKGLRGDPSDNIPGIKGIGEVTATILITTFGSIEQIYKKLAKDRQAFVDAGLSERIIGLLEAGKEEAEFSKMLGTIRRDAPITYIVPEKSWSETVDIKKAEKLFNELEFRTLSARLHAVLGKNPPATTAPILPTEDFPPADFKRLAVALWVLDSNKTNPTREDILAYANTETLAEASKIIFNRLEKEAGSKKVYEEIELPLIPIIEKMERVGVRVSTEYLKKLSTDYHAQLAGIEKEIISLALPFTQGSGMENFNIASPKQLGEILFVKMGLAGKRQKKTSTGNFSTKESELEKIKFDHPIIPLILKHREFSKLLGTYIDTLPELIRDDGRIHAQFIPAGSTTGRMASQNPNLQNIPNKGELGRAIRHAFVAENGFKIVAFDYSQIELRIAAFLSKDEKMLAIFRDGEDIHTAVASEVFGVDKASVTKDMRRQAKVINFGIMYGMGVTALQTNLAPESTDGVAPTPISRAEAQKFYDNYFANFSGLATYLNEVKASAYRTGFTETFFGRRRYFEGIKSKLPFIRASAERMAINAPIQGTEADIVKLAMIQIENYLKKEGIEDSVRVLLQVHDELVYEVRKDLIEKVVPAVKKIMEQIIDPKDIHGVVCTAEASVGENWGDMRKI